MPEVYFLYILLIFFGSALSQENIESICALLHSTASVKGSICKASTTDRHPFLKNSLSYMYMYILQKIVVFFKKKLIYREFCIIYFMQNVLNYCFKYQLILTLTFLIS